MLAAILIALLFGALGGMLDLASRRLRVEGDPLSEQIDGLLPQTQCGQCGYPGCRPYAEAIARSEVGIDRCPPGGEETLEALAELLGIDPEQFDGLPFEKVEPSLAVIDEPACIGCAQCLLVCPVDAILGAPRLMHTVIASECTGCGLCLPPCPVECIELVPLQRHQEIRSDAGPINRKGMP